jgi:hypothetical protein
MIDLVNADANAIYLVESLSALFINTPNNFAVV